MTMGKSNDALSTSFYLSGREMLFLFDTEGYARALPLFLQALEEKDSAAVHAALAETYAFWGSRREKSGEECVSYYNLAFEEARRALELDPRGGDPHRAMAVALRAGPLEDRNARLAEARLACELNPYDGQNLCELWRASGRDPDDSLIAKGLALFPRHCGAQIDLGVALCEAERLDEAALHLWRALEINPRNSLALYDLAMVELRMGTRADAEQTLLRALAMHPDDPLLLSGLELAKADVGEAAAVA
jgi:tetratricopeptide (TPR) repeat protein